MMYIVDTNIFIRSYHEMPMDIWETFWKRITEAANAGLLFSITAVKEEIEKGNDTLKQWIKENLPSNFFFKLDDDILQCYQETQEWAAAQPHFKETAREDFAILADAFLIAAAKSKGATLITYEKSDMNSRKRVKIPDVCQALGVPYCDLNAFLRDNNIKI